MTGKSLLCDKYYPIFKDLFIARHSYAIRQRKTGQSLSKLNRTGRSCFFCFFQRNVRKHRVLSLSP